MVNCTFSMSRSVFSFYLFANWHRLITRFVKRCRDCRARERAERLLMIQPLAVSVREVVSALQRGRGPAQSHPQVLLPRLAGLETLCAHAEVRSRTGHRTSTQTTFLEVILCLSSLHNYSETFSFVLTGEDGSRWFCYCRKILVSAAGARKTQQLSRYFALCLSLVLSCAASRRQCLDSDADGMRVSASFSATSINSHCRNDLVF